VSGVGCIAPLRSWLCVCPSLSKAQHNPTPKQLELENWVEGSKPLTAAEAHRATILQQGIIDAHPRSGRLAPHHDAQIVLRAAAVMEGEWALPLFLRVKDGRQLHLALKVSERG